MAVPVSETNPYAPPQAEVHRIQRDHEFQVWREGDRLLIRAGASLPKFCMKTGEPAPYSHPITHFWQPTWTYALLLLFVLPYLIVSPFYRKRVDIEVPFGRTLLRRQKRWVNAGLLFAACGAVLVISVLLIGLVTRSDFAGLLVILGIAIFICGVRMASSYPLRLHILSVERDLIVLDSVHPDYLARLPDLSQ